MTGVLLAELKAKIDEVRYCSYFAQSGKNQSQGGNILGRSGLGDR